MRYVWLTFMILLIGMLAFVGWQRVHLPPHPSAEVTTAFAPTRPVSDPAPDNPLAAPALAAAGPLPRADSLIRFARQQLGSPYTYAGTTPGGGFDCSGFLLFVYGHFGVSVPHSTALLIATGRPIARAEAQPGDMVVFTGTATTATTPGHAGIVISEPGQPLQFIHSSSARRESGVKISQVEGTDYERRFMGIRRVLGENLAPALPTAVPAAATKIEVKTKAAATGTKYKVSAPVRR
ncbi:C40 family peptidase [Hymenobacter algoricola]|uniref:NlpC/P60 domain-containing protein n=1 Tax=Hymenobacter algoricola TaxID=486267 RepID=A0ABP7NJC0_9BACT